jgi:6-phosphogluconolactonase
MNLTKIYDRSAEQLISTVADKTVVAITHAWRERRDAHIVLTGGRNGIALVKALDFALFRATAVDRSSNSEQESGQVHIWFSDERFSELTDPDRTDTKLIDTFNLAKSRLVFHRVNAISDSNLDEAAMQYADQIHQSLGEKRFDVVILSLGEDGHIASCFPGDDSVLTATTSTAAVRNSPKPPAQRVTITLSRLARCNQMYVLAVGESKKLALDQTLAQSALMPVEIMRRNSLHGQILVLTDQN